MPGSGTYKLHPVRVPNLHQAAVYHTAGELHRLLHLSRQASTPSGKKKHRLLAQQCMLPMVQLAADITGETYGAGASSQLLSLLETIVKITL